MGGEGDKSERTTHKPLLIDAATQGRRHTLHSAHSFQSFSLCVLSEWNGITSDQSPEHAPEPVHADLRHASLTWKNHAATDAGPTVRNGVAKPSANTILSAFDAFELWVERRRAPGGSIYLEMMMLFIKLYMDAVECKSGLPAVRSGFS